MHLQVLDAPVEKWRYSKLLDRRETNGKPWEERPVDREMYGIK